MLQVMGKSWRHLRGNKREGYIQVVVQSFKVAQVERETQRDHCLCKPGTSESSCPGSLGSCEWQCEIGRRPYPELW